CPRRRRTARPSRGDASGHGQGSGRAIRLGPSRRRLPRSARPASRTRGAGLAVTQYRFIALGDSVTVGMGDPMPGGAGRGRAAMVADCRRDPPAGGVEFHNLAEPGALAITLHERQLPAALNLRPTVAALVVGANDTLRGSFNLAATGRALDD